MPAKRKRMPTADTVDRHVLYQQSVQAPSFELDFMHTVFKACRKRAPRSMREDFCGTALACAQWVERHRENTAVGVDLDREVLAWGELHNLGGLKRSQRERVSLQVKDVLRVGTRVQYDFIQALNFSYWILMERAQLLAYFKRVRKALKPDGILFLDAFGGYAAHKTGIERREVDGFVYEWEQATFNPVTNRMQCYIHFAFKDKSRLDRAYSYRWRLWGAAEIRDLLQEAGFATSLMYLQAFDPETDEPIDEYVCTDECEDHACWLGYIVALR
ncbi:MAG: class I SAM-dependent methyltransferase [Pseudomonadota bacterium]